jgi:hypothetical protein
MRLPEVGEHHPASVRALLIRQGSEEPLNQPELILIAQRIRCRR